MRVVEADGGERDVRTLFAAVVEALDGGEPVFPVAPGSTATVAAMRPDEPVPEQTAVLIATSGTSGRPKGVLLSARALTASARATHARLGGPGRWLLATPAQYVGGLQVLVRSLLSGLEPGVMDLRPGFRTDAFAAAAAPVLAQSGPHYTALVPTQLGRILDAGGGALDAARGFDRIIIGGAALTPELRGRALDAGLRVVSAYGMTETSSGCVYDGKPLDGVHVRLTPDGRVQVSGEVLAIGYRDRGSWHLDDGWFTTNDLARWVDGAHASTTNPHEKRPFLPPSEPTLEIIGRADDVINTGGVKVPAAVVERAIRAHPGVRDCTVVGVADPEWGEIVAALVVPTDPDQPPSTAELRAAVRSAAGKAAAPRVVRMTHALPETGPGKADRSAVRVILADRS